MSIEELGDVFSSYIHHHWEEVLNTNRVELENLFPEYEDATYGMYLDHLLPPIWQKIEKAGYQSAEETKEDDFIIAGCLNFRNSIEKAKWGTPDYETRVFWIVIENKSQEKIGTLIFELPHSHLKFDFPAAPKLTSFPSTDKNEIKHEISIRKEES